MRRRFIAFASSALLVSGCHDVTRFSNDGDHYEGSVVEGSFVRTGIGPDAGMCLTIDATHLQDQPGTITTSDGLFQATALRPIPQIWHDPLSTLTFGEGRTQNLLYVATPRDGDAGAGPDAIVVLSLMQSGEVEGRVLRGAPGGAPSDAPNLFGVFTMKREKGSCSF
jgi:hypothetical protein